MTYSKDNLPNHIVRHSPTGMNWGYGGSGPSDLALSILYEVVGQEQVEKYYQDFKWEFVANFKDNWKISDKEIIKWIKNKEKNK